MGKTGAENTGNEKSASAYARRAKEFYAVWRASQRIGDAWENWRDYRRKVTDYIIENSNSGTSLAVFGAGRCNDLDLSRLLQHFSQVTLFDRDEEAMREAIGNVKNLQENNLKNFAADFVGIDPADYIAFAEALLQFREAETFHAAARAADRLSQMYAKSHRYIDGLLERAKRSEKVYDYTVTLGVHSQLGNVPAWLLCTAETELWGGKEESCGDKKQGAWQRIKGELLEKMEEESRFFSIKLNDLILSVTKQKAFIGCEVSQAVCKENEWYAVSDSAVSGAWQAIEDMWRRALCGSIRFEHYLDIIWPFFPAQEKAYRMMVMEAENV